MRISIKITDAPEGTFQSGDIAITSKFKSLRIGVVHKVTDYNRLGNRLLVSWVHGYPPGLMYLWQKSNWCKLKLSFNPS